MRKKFAIFSGIILIMAFILMTYMGYELLYPFNPGVVKSPYPVLTKEVRAGDNIIYSVEYCKYMDLEVKISRRIQDDIVYLLPDTTNKNPLGCGTKNLSMQIPPTLPAGNYTIKFLYTFEISKLRNIKIEAETEPFKVIVAK